ncbi:putative chromatin regulator PHD family [Arabidopsis thaliana]
MDSEVEENVISVITDTTFLISTNLKVDPRVISLFSQLFYDWRSVYMEIKSLYPKMEFHLLLRQILKFWTSTDMGRQWKFVSLICKIMFLVSSMDLDSESELTSLIKKIISLFNSKPDTGSELVSLITQLMRIDTSVDSDSEPTQESELLSLISQLVSAKPEPELTSLTRRIISTFISMNWEPMQFISVCPQVMVELVHGKLTTEVVRPRKAKERECELYAYEIWKSTRQIHFHCILCNGENHEEYDKVPIEVKHPLHPRHSLQLAVRQWSEEETMIECYCCDEYLMDYYYYCSSCDFAMNVSCLEKPPPVLSIDHPKWHQHPLILFPSQASFPCNLCALTHASCPFYICPPCDFVVHQKCLSLPHVIRISRHHHRISFTPSFEKGNWYCGICRKKMDNDYGGYTCLKDGCSYVAHSRCATQKNVWDGLDLEGEPEEVEEEEVEPFVIISDGTIHHFSHPHHLRIDKNTGRDYDENKQCQACITPIYFGNIYSCMQCNFILHEECANFSRKIHNPIHPHKLNLVGGYDGVTKYYKDFCSVCPRMCTNGFFYECGKEECDRFKLHVQCATISEPLVHESHVHPLFLTSKPRERRRCGVCKKKPLSHTETFNCIEGECTFALCFGCATLPHEVRYKHDKHMLTLSYGEETSTMMYWCEACEKEINSEERFYKCDEYCCVTLHIQCLIGKELYLKPGSSFEYDHRHADVLLKTQVMSRPICFQCKSRCPHNTVIQWSELVYCTIHCFCLVD